VFAAPSMLTLTGPMCAARIPPRHHGVVARETAECEAAASVDCQASPSHHGVSEDAQSGWQFLNAALSTNIDDLIVADFEGLRRPIRAPALI
jgi:hypothetical protein